MFSAYDCASELFIFDLLHAPFVCYLVQVNGLIAFKAGYRGVLRGVYALLCDFSSIPPIAEKGLCFGFVLQFGLCFGFFPRLKKVWKGQFRQTLVPMNSLRFPRMYLCFANCCFSRYLTGVTLMLSFLTVTTQFSIVRLAANAC